MRSILNARKYPIFLSLYAVTPNGYNFIQSFKRVDSGSTFTYRETGLINLTVYTGISQMEGASFCINEDIIISGDEEIKVDKPLKEAPCTPGRPDWPNRGYIGLCYIILYFVLFGLASYALSGSPNLPLAFLLLILWMFACMSVFVYTTLMF